VTTTRSKRTDTEERGPIVQSEIRTALRRYTKLFADAARDGIQEADTVTRLIRFFEDVLGYDPFDEITREHAVKSTYVDLALTIDGQVKLLVEAKAAGSSLREAYTQQAQNYAANLGVPWVLLTNGCQFILYRVELEGAIETWGLFDINIVDGDPTESAKMLALIHRKAMARGKELEEFWHYTKSLAPEVLLKALCAESVIRAIRKELRNLTDHLLPVDDVFEALKALIAGAGSADIHKLTMRRKLKPRRDTTEPTQGDSDRSDDHHVEDD